MRLGREIENPYCLSGLRDCGIINTHSHARFLLFTNLNGSIIVDKVPKCPAYKKPLYNFVDPDLIFDQLVCMNQHCAWYYNVTVPALKKRVEEVQKENGKETN